MNDCIKDLSQRLPYLEAVLMEVQRFTSLIPLVNHVALEDTGICPQCHLTTRNLRNFL